MNNGAVFLTLIFLTFVTGMYAGKVKDSTARAIFNLFYWMFLAMAFLSLTFK